MRTPPEMICGFLIQLVFCKKKKTMWFIGVEVKLETSAPPPKKNPGSAPDITKGFSLRHTSNASELNANFRFVFITILGVFMPLISVNLRSLCA